MKKTTAIILLCLLPAAYADYWLGRGKGGGVIILEETACPGKTGWREGKAKTPEGKTLEFCYTTRNGKYLAVYEDGRTFEYPPALFQRFAGKP